MYTFIPVTKTGCTAFKKIIQQYYLKYFFNVDQSHHIKCLNNNNPILTIRDPIDRFISIYRYWKYGSECYKRNRVFIEKYKNYNIKHFINLLKTKSKKDLYNTYTWNVHFEPQTYWINCDYKNIIIIKYDNDLNNKFNILLDKLCIPNLHSKLEHINISNNTEPISLDDDDVQFIKEYFKDDYQLIDTINNHPELFKMVI